MTEMENAGAGAEKPEVQVASFSLEEAGSVRTPETGVRTPEGSRRKRKPLNLAVLAGVVLLVGYGVVRLLFSFRAGEGVVDGELTYRVTRGDLRISFTERGEVKAAKSVEVISQVEGVTRIVSVVPEGTFVEKGDILIELDSSELTQAINQQEIAVETAEANYLQAQKQVEIQKSLNASSLDQARLDLELAKLDLEKYTGEKDLGPGPWNPLPLLGQDESLLADVTDETSREIRAALEKAARLVEAEHAALGEKNGGDGRGSEGTPSPSLPADPASAQLEAGPSSAVVAAAVAERKETADSVSPASPAVPEAELRTSLTQGVGVKKLRTGDFLLAFKKAIADLKIASAEVARAKNQWEWTARLAEKGYVTGTELTADTLSLQRAELNKQQAQGALELFLTYTWRKEFAKYRSAVEQATAALERAEQKAAAQLAQAEADLRAKETTYNLSKKRLQKLKDQLEKTKIRAPQSGMVVYVQERRFGGREMIIEPGAEVRENQLLMRLPDVSVMAVSVDVHESWVDQVREGTPAFVSIDALPNLKLRGRVTKIGLLPDAVNRWLNPDLKVYQTEVTIEDCPEVKLLRPGMSAKVEIVTAVLKDVYYVPLQSVTTLDREQVCYVLERGKFVPRRVQGGRFNESFIEIVSGLSEGDIVQLNPPAPKESEREKRRPAEEEELGAEPPGPLGEEAARRTDPAELPPGLGAGGAPGAGEAYGPGAKIPGVGQRGGRMPGVLGSGEGVPAPSFGPQGEAKLPAAPAEGAPSGGEFRPPRERPPRGPREGGRGGPYSGPEGKGAAREPRVGP